MEDGFIRRPLKAPDAHESCNSPHGSVSSKGKREEKGAESQAKRRGHISGIGHRSTREPRRGRQLAAEGPLYHRDDFLPQEYPACFTNDTMQPPNICSLLGRLRAPAACVGCDDRLVGASMTNFKAAQGVSSSRCLKRWPLREQTTEHG